MFRRWRLFIRCRMLAGQCRQDGLRSYIDTCTGLHIDKLDNTPVISVDLELTGLDYRKNHIIAIGWTLLDQGRIHLGSNRHIMINTDQSNIKNRSLQQVFKELWSKYENSIHIK